MSKAMIGIEQEILDPRADDRIRRYTASHVNARIDRLTWATIQQSVAAGRDAIIARLKELDREWNVDRVLMANFALLGAVTSELGRRHPAWKYFFRAQQGFLLLHAIAGWCPPLPLFRRLGFRTDKEIAAERHALIEGLKALLPQVSRS
jgi:hypothetical protein